MPNGVAFVHHGPNEALKLKAGGITGRKSRILIKPTNSMQTAQFVRLTQDTNTWDGVNSKMGISGKFGHGYPHTRH
jgi:hypothetical protein